MQARGVGGLLRLGEFFNHHALVEEQFRWGRLRVELHQHFGWADAALAKNLLDELGQLFIGEMLGKIRVGQLVEHHGPPVFPGLGVLLHEGLADALPFLGVYGPQGDLLLESARF